MSAARLSSVARPGQATRPSGYSTRSAPVAGQRQLHLVCIGGPIAPGPSIAASGTVKRSGCHCRTAHSAESLLQDSSQLSGQRTAHASGWRAGRRTGHLGRGRTTRGQVILIYRPVRRPRAPAATLLVHAKQDISQPPTPPAQCAERTGRSVHWAPPARSVDTSERAL